ncbi:sugar ABC transporter permease [Paenibacillus qinlingensis]|uniref:Multiple sugar transport system permease protein n=1 Tax=Paenibacillus qinlingensis TaxID=1837343 RepID=A0ABU1NTZ6_9BACL|nr:sugar ABC transporter permease [Paenibacillus qinlingensis]MDR6550951.1 multiple sugar transport system permease protein [Paenibacillus qinlingensis]
MTTIRFKRKPIIDQGRAAFFFLLPTALILSLFVFWPILNSFWLSLHQWSLLESDHPYTGLSNYIQLMQDERFWNSVRNTIYFTVGSVPLGIICSLLLALLCNLTLKGMNFFKAIYFLPVISSFAVLSIIWSFLMDPDIGLISYYFHLIGFSVTGWLRDPTLAMPAVILIAIWKNVGFNMVIFMAGLQGISVSLYEAAKIDGANTIQKFWHITVPSLTQTTLFVIIISIIASFQVFDQVFVMTHGGPLFSTETIVYYIYHQGFELLDMGYASSAAWFLFIVVFLITLTQLKLFKYNETD